MDQFMPLTFHVTTLEDEEWTSFKAAFTKHAQDEDKARATNLWILKPAMMSNRGFGIRVSNDLDEIDGILRSEARSDARCGGWVVQRYIERPLLVHGRKFDIRAFALLVAGRGGEIRAYVHEAATYVRTCGERYSTRASDFGNRGMHLANDGVQKHTDAYGRHESANKLSMADFHAYLVAEGRCDSAWLDGALRPRIRDLVARTVDAAADSINPNKHAACFELLGFDFMLDDDLNVVLIEINSNPCLELCCPLLEDALPNLIHDVMAAGLDAVLPPPKPAHRTRRQAEALEAIADRGHGFDLVYGDAPDDAPRRAPPAAAAPGAAAAPEAADAPRRRRAEARRPQPADDFAGAFSPPAGAGPNVDEGGFLAEVFERAGAPRAPKPDDDHDSCDDFLFDDDGGAAPPRPAPARPDGAQAGQGGRGRARAKQPARTMEPLHL